MSTNVTYRFNRNFWRQWRRWGQWLFVQPKRIWLFLGVIAAVSVFADWGGCRFDLPRVERLPYAGWVLEMLGVLIAVYGFNHRLGLFGQSISSAVLSWLQTFPMLSRDHRVTAGTGHLRASGSTVHATLSVPMPPNATLEERIERLERVVDNVDGELSALRQNAERDVNNLRNEITERLGDIRGEISDVRDQTSEAHAGGAGVELLGLALVITGLTLATIPAPLSWMVSHLLEAFPSLVYSC